MLLRVLGIACITSAARVESGRRDDGRGPRNRLRPHLGRRRRDATEVKRLLDRGADAAQDEGGRDGAPTAGISGDAAVVRLLVEAGADVHARPRPTRSTHAAPGVVRSDLHLEERGLLQEAGADLNLVLIGKMASSYGPRYGRAWRREPELSKPLSGRRAGNG